MTVVTLDHRERVLSDALQIEHLMSDLPVGDILLRFDGGAEWIVERKTMRDLASSIRRRLSSSMRHSRTCQKCEDLRVCVCCSCKVRAAGKNNYPDCTPLAMQKFTSLSKEISARKGSGSHLQHCSAPV